MAQFGKASAKRGKPSYIYAIIGVALVLFLFGIVGWIFLNIRKTGEYFKENVQLNAYLFPTATNKQIDSVKNYISLLPYARKVRYISREEALEIYNKEMDTSYKKLGIERNPLPPSIEFSVTAEYVDNDSLTKIENHLISEYGNIVSQFQTPATTVAGVSKFVKTSTIILLILAIVLSVFVIISIDNTIRLAMYSNRFLIKTMQMVGATRWFIIQPIDIRAIINGLIAAAIAIALLTGAIFLAENNVPNLKNIHDTSSLILLYIAITLLGLFITLFSTHRSVLKYLRMKLDDLY